jgi:hypothetical protein
MPWHDRFGSKAEILIAQLFPEGGVAVRRRTGIGGEAGIERQHATPVECSISAPAGK